MVTINEIRNLTNNERDEIRDDLRPNIYDYVERIGWTSNAHKSFACPICGAGSRTPNTSINPHTFCMKSWSCGCFEGRYLGVYPWDLFAVIAYNEPSVNDVPYEALAFACNLYGYSLSAKKSNGQSAVSATVHERKYQPAELADPIPPSQQWQDEAERFVTQCEKNFWSASGDKARRYMMEQRKLTAKTLKHFRIGYNPKTFYLNGEWKAPAGITIPTYVSGVLYRVKVRTDSGKPKYQNYKDSVGCCPFNDYDLLHEIDVVLVEGEIDAMTVYQEGDCGVCTFGSANSIEIAVTWREWLKNPDRICICMDADDAGDSANNALLAEIRRLRNIRPVTDDSVFIEHLPNPEHKPKYDWSAFFADGGDITETLDGFFPLMDSMTGVIHHGDRS